ncbi:hypothetical protein HanIR_Chr06g0274971 [Helianthus annuus]|nr:hypothetical protein HanIR_Chr06g0274971 [Helianthus annuus]
MVMKEGRKTEFTSKSIAVGEIFIVVDVVKISSRFPTKQNPGLKNWGKGKITPLNV